MAQRLSTPATATIMQLPTIIRVVLIIALLGFIGLMFNQIKHDREVKHIQSIEIKSNEAKLIELDNKYQEVLELKSNTEAEKEEQSKKIKELEEERERLQRELQAKLDRQAKEEQRLAQVAKKATGTQTASAITGNKYDWLRASGIPESDWRFVDEIINRESSWNYKAVNRSSGATGLCQSLPASKMASAGGDYLTNPVTQLKWCHSYAQGYGSWAKAAEYSRCVGSCFSTRANRTVYKDHKWW